MREHGAVVRKEADRVYIEVEKKGDCGRCGLCPAGEGRLLEIEAPGLSVGDRVVVDISEGELIRLALVVYLLPAAVFVTGLVVGAALFTESAGFFAGLGLLALMLPWSRRYARRHGARIRATRLEGGRPEA
jgi:positive regulator of sigma E activity